MLPGFLILEKFLEDKDLFGKETDKDILIWEKTKKKIKPLMTIKKWSLHLN